MAHYSAYSGRIFQILLIQGLGSIFNLYAYMKTKNVFVSYIVHLMIDFSGFIVSAIQAGVHLFLLVKILFTIFAINLFEIVKFS